MTSTASPGAIPGFRLPGSAARAWLLLFLAHGVGVAPVPCRGQTPPNLTIAFIGDQGLGTTSLAVLNLIRSEGADAVVHSGDFDYADNPAAWDAQINAVLGPDFPYFASIGNHDTSRFLGPGGYQEFLAARMNRLGIPWADNLGVQCNFVYAGIHFVLTGAGTSGSGHDTYIRNVFAASGSPWRISSWHKDQHLLQPEGKSDETGWGVYEESRRAGAIIATGHAHAYSRTHLLSSMQNQVIASTSNMLEIARDDPATLPDEGRSFAFVSGLGGRDIRSQQVSGNWFACIYTSTQNAAHGALFGVFNYYGFPTFAHFYLKTVTGEIRDEFYVHSLVLSGPSDAAAGGDLLSLQLVPGNPTRARVALVYQLPMPAAVTLRVVDVRGRVIHEAFRGLLQPAGTHRWEWDAGAGRASGVYFFQLRTPLAERTVRTVLLR